MKPLFVKMKMIAIVSGKGGVGKSTFASILAARMSERFRVLLIDLDFTGPSNIFNVEGSVKKTKKGLSPIEIKKNLYYLSMSTLSRKDDAIIWRTPKKLQLLEMFYNSIFDDALQYEFVLFDTPPGITIVHKFLKSKSIRPLLITTSQNVAVNDSINTIYFFQSGGRSDDESLEDQKNNFSNQDDAKNKGRGETQNISQGNMSKDGFDMNKDSRPNAHRNLINKKSGFYGVVENMSGLPCTKCGKLNLIFSKNGGKYLAEDFNLPFLGTIEIDRQLSDAIETGQLVNRLKNFKFISTIDEIITQIEIS